MHKESCILSNPCKISDTDACTNHCPHYILIHGASGLGGRVGNANVPGGYRLLTVNNSPARNSQPRVYSLIETYIKTFDRQFDTGNERVKSLFLFSQNPGTGKTTTASVLINEWLISHYLGSLKRGLQPLQQPAYFLDVNAWQELYTGFTRPGIPQDIAEQNSRPYYRQLETAKRVPFVVLDDIGVRTASDGFRGDLHTIINYRCANGLPTVYTSNLPIEDMAQVFDVRLYDRMRDMCLDIHFEGSSNRGRR